MASVVQWRTTIPIGEVIPNDLAREIDTESRSSPTIRDQTTMAHWVSSYRERYRAERRRRLALIPVINQLIKRSLLASATLLYHSTGAQLNLDRIAPLAEVLQSETPADAGQVIASLIEVIDDITDEALSHWRGQIETFRDDDVMTDISEVLSLTDILVRVNSLAQ